VRVLQLDPGHFANPDAGDPHVVVLADAPSLAECCVIDVPAADQREVLGVERAEQQQADQAEAYRPDRDGVSFTEGDHYEHLADDTA